MTSTDKITLIAAVSSAIVTLVALFVACLARRDSKKSANAAQQANDLMTRQLKLAEGELNRQIQKDILDSQPQIIWDYGSAGSQSVTHKLKNYGGAMSNVTVTCDAGFRATVSPKDVIAQGTDAEVNFVCNQQPQPNPFKFSVEFDDKFKQHKTLIFSASRKQGGSWELPEPSK